MIERFVTLCLRRRKLHSVDSLRNTLPRPVVVHSVLKHQRDERKAERAVRTHDLEARNPVQFPLERNRHLLFHLFRRMTGELRDHLRCDIGNVRIGLNLQSLPRRIA